ncbi:MAG: glutathione ABC transporter substrate-binding protein, partial [Solibacillus sp.]
SSQHGDPGNRSFYNSPEVDALLDKGRREIDPAAREAIYKEALQKISDDSPMAFVLHPAYLTGVADKVSGFNVNSAGIYQLKDVKITE